MSQTKIEQGTTLAGIQRISSMSGGSVPNKRRLKRTYAILGKSYRVSHYSSMCNIFGPTGISEGQLSVPPLQSSHNHHSAFVIPRLEPPIQRPTSDTDFLTRLNLYTQPGLYIGEFRGLIGRMAQCSCGMVMVRDVFDEHRCERSALRPIKRARLG